MSTQNFVTLTPLTSGLRIISGDISGEVLDGNSSFIAELGNVERIIKPLVISNDAGYVVEITECSWLEKTPGAAPALAPNQLRIVVRGHPHTPGANGYPHSLLPAYTDLTAVTFQIVAIVH